MSLRRCLFLFITLLYSGIALCQHVDQGCYNDWDYGPHGVYGNLLLTKTKVRPYFKIEADGAEQVKVSKINPSGVVTDVAMVKFANGLLSEADFADHWGKTYEYRHYQPKDSNTFRVTDLVRGSNIFLPCKYAVYTYTGELLSKLQYYSSNDQLRENRNGVAIIRYKRYADKVRFSELQETSFYDAKDQPVISRFTGYHKLTSTYDDHDNKTVVSYSGVRGEPVLARLYGVWETTMTYDTDNNLTADQYHGLDGNITENTYGVSKTVRDYEDGYLMKIARFDSLGRATRAQASGDGISVIKYEYDTAGNQTREYYFDQSGKPMNDQQGVQEIAQWYGPDNTLVRITYFDQSGQPCVNRDKINSKVFVRDAQNRIIWESGYDVDGKLVKTYTEEVFMIKREYDKFEREIFESYWADSTTRMTHWDGSYRRGTKYNDDGQVTEYTSYDEKGQPFLSGDGSSTMRLVYNADCRLEERQFLFNDQLIERKNGIAEHFSIIKYGYDEGNRENELSFWATEQQPVDASISIDDSVTAHRIVFIYRGNRIIEERYFKIGGEQPFKIVDCLKNDFLGLSGINQGRKIER